MLWSDQVYLLCSVTTALSALLLRLSQISGELSSPRYYVTESLMKLAGAVALYRSSGMYPKARQIKTLAFTSRESTSLSAMEVNRWVHGSRVYCWNTTVEFSSS